VSTIPKKEKNKGNGAYKRMSNPRRKARRIACWTRGQKRKDARRKAQAEREAANRILWAEMLAN